MKIFTYLLLQFLGSISFLLNAAWATFEPTYLRLALFMIGILLLVASFKVLSLAVGKLTVREVFLK